MTNYTGRRGRFWTDAETAELLALADAIPAISQAAMALALGRSISSIEGKLRMERDRRALGIPTPAPGHAPYERPDLIQNNDAKHLRAVIAHGGFSWLVKREEAA